MGQQIPGTLDPSILSFLQGAAAGPPISPLMELAKLIASALSGLIVTLTHRYTLKERTLSRSMLQASVLLAVAGALMMIIIGNSTARALGIAGGASIIRFRTPVDDPKDAILLFLLMGLGMAAGLGSFAVCALGTAFLCVFLLLLNHLGEGKARTVILSTHILPEVEAICQRVIIMHRGRKALDAPLAELQSGGASLEEIFARTTAREIPVPEDAMGEARP